jgi:hypothetical protein
MPEGDDQKPARFEQCRKFAEGTAAVTRRYMLPDGRKQEEIKREPQCMRGVKGGQPVVEPAYGCLCVEPPAGVAHARSRLDSDDIEPEGGQPSGVAAGACANIERQPT